MWEGALSFAVKLFSKYSNLCENHTSTDGRTDGETIYCGITALCVASRGKNGSRIYPWNCAYWTDLRWISTTDQSDQGWRRSPRRRRRRRRMMRSWKFVVHDCRSIGRSVAPSCQVRRTTPRCRRYSSYCFRCTGRQTSLTPSVMCQQQQHGVTTNTIPHLEDFFSDFGVTCKTSNRRLRTPAFNGDRAFIGTLASSPLRLLLLCPLFVPGLCQFYCSC